MPNPNTESLNRINPRWIIVGLLVTATFALGFAGFQQYFVQRGEARGTWDVLYLTLQLFTLESGGVEPPVPATLQWARFLGAAASIYAIILTLIKLFSGQLQRALIRLFGGHVVVCGLGRKGERIVRQLRAAKRRVAIIEADESNPNLDRCRELGCYVIVGRANDEWELQKAFVSRASCLLCLAGDDDVNVETVVRAHQLVRDRQGKHLRCVVHMSDPQLQTTILEHDIFSSQQDPIDVEFVNTFELGARVMARNAETLLENLHYLIVGLGNFGEALLHRIVKDWHLEVPAKGRLRITIADACARDRQLDFEEHFADSLSSVDLSFEQCNIHDQRELAATVRRAMDGGNRIDVAFVCLDDDRHASHGALTMRKELLTEIPIFVRMSEEAGLATLLGTKETGEGIVANVHAVGLLDVACDVELMLNGAREALAQAIHQGYVQDQRAAGKTIADNASIRPWHRLSDEVKDSNRDQADHINVKLAMIGCELVAKPTGLMTLLVFTDQEIDRLAPVEHERWLNWQETRGWTWGEVRNERRKTNPHHVDWEELSEEIRDYNRDAIRRIPKILARSDFEIRRIESADVT